MNRHALLQRALPLMLALLLAACSQRPTCPSASESPSAGQSPQGEIWVATGFNVAGLEQLDPLLTRGYFGTPNSYVIQTSAQWPWASSSLRTASWASAAKFAEDVRQADGTLAGVDAVLYDPEAWASTPLEEQRDPASAMERFAELGHHLGYDVIITPGLQLTDVDGALCQKTDQESDVQAFTRCDIAGDAAHVADIVEIQAQSLQARPEDYRAFVRSAANQARQANPDVQVIAGFALRSPEEVQDAERSWASVRGVADGHYLSMTPAEGIAFLAWVESCASPEEQRMR